MEVTEMKLNKGVLKDYAALMVWIVVLLFVGGVFNLGLAAELPKVTQEKVEHFKMAVKLYQSGWRLFENNEFEKAKKEFGKSLERFEGFSDAYLALARLHYRTGDFKKALKCILLAKANYRLTTGFLQQVTQENNSRIMEQLHQIDTYIRNRSGDIRRANNCRGNPVAVRDVKSAIKERSHLATGLRKETAFSMVIPACYYYLHGNIYYKMGNLAGACEEYDRAIAIAPKYGMAYNNIIHILSGAKQFEAAMEYVKLAESNGVNINGKLVTLCKNGITKN